MNSVPGPPKPIARPINFEPSPLLSVDLLRGGGRACPRRPFTPPDGRRCVFECGGAIRHPSRPRITRMPGFYPCPECGNEDTEWATAAPNLSVCRLEVTAKTLGYGRSGAYAAVKSRTFPVPIIGGPGKWS